MKRLKYRPIEGAFAPAIPAPGSASVICMQRITACVLQREKKAANWASHFDAKSVGPKVEKKTPIEDFTKRSQTSTDAKLGQSQVFFLRIEKIAKNSAYHGSKLVNYSCDSRLGFSYA